MLIDIARSKFYRRLEYKNLGEYVQGRLEVQGDYAHVLAKVANRATELKSLEKALRAGRLSRCFSTRILSIIDLENQEEVVEFACTHTFEELRAYVNKLNCGEQYKERLYDIGENHHRLTCDFTDEEIDLFRRVQSIEAQANRGHTIRNALVRAWQCYLKYNCKVEKAERAHLRRDKAAAKAESVSQEKSVSQETPVTQKPKRIPLTAEQKNAVLYETKGRCTQIVNGKRCNSRHISEIHNIIRVADGGSNEPHNLTTLCWFHHALKHEGEYRGKLRKSPVPPPIHNQY